MNDLQRRNVASWAAVDRRWCLAMLCLNVSGIVGAAAMHVWFLLGLNVLLAVGNLFLIAGATKARRMLEEEFK